MASSSPLPELVRFILERTGYRKMLEQERTPDAEARLENLNELINAAAEAAERGETVSDFLDHAALVSEADAFDERAPGDPDDPAQRQGSGVPGGLYDGHGTGPVSPQPVAWIPRPRSKRSAGFATWA